MHSAGRPVLICIIRCHAIPYTCNISGGISRNSTKYCKAGEIVIVINVWMQRINRSISMVIWIEVRAIISMSLILWYNFVTHQHRYHRLIYFIFRMTLTSSQVDTFHISRVFHRLIANRTPSSENFIFQMWLPSPCSSSGKSRSQSRQVPPMEAGRWVTLWDGSQCDGAWLTWEKMSAIVSWENIAFFTRSCLKDLMWFQFNTLTWSYENIDEMKMLQQSIDQMHATK